MAVKTVYVYVTMKSLEECCNYFTHQLPLQTPKFPNTDNWQNLYENLATNSV